MKHPFPFRRSESNPSCRHQMKKQPKTASKASSQMTLASWKDPEFSCLGKTYRHLALAQQRGRWRVCWFVPQLWFVAPFKPSVDVNSEQLQKIESSPFRHRTGVFSSRLGQEYFKRQGLHGDNRKGYSAMFVILDTQHPVSPKAVLNYWPSDVHCYVMCWYVRMMWCFVM